MAKEYTSKVVYHFIEGGEKVKQIQLFRSFEDAIAWGTIQKIRGFEPVSVENNAIVDEGTYHVGDEAPQVHRGHYAQSNKKEDV